MANGSSQGPSKTKNCSAPLTAYNLYFRYERARLLSAGKASGGCSPAKVTSSDLREFMAKNPYQSPASRKKRSHTKTHGAFSFTQLSRTVSQSWRDLDAKSKEPFDEVAYELKVLYYRKLEEERQKAKQNEVVETKGDASIKASPVGGERDDMPTLAFNKTPRLISKKKKPSNDSLLVSEKSPRIQTQDPNPRRISLNEVSSAKKSRIEMERFMPFPGSPFISSSPERTPDTFLGSSANGTGPERMLVNGPAIEPIPLHQNIHEGSPVLEKDFAKVWLMNTFHDKGPKLTHDKNRKTKQGPIMHTTISLF